MMNRKQNRGKLISEYSGDIFLKGKSFRSEEHTSELQSH